MKNTIVLLYLAIFFTAFITQTASATEGNAERKKARYYLLEGSRQAALENLPEAYEYYRKAYSIDSTYNDAAYTYGMQRIFLRNDSLQTQKQLYNTLGLLRQYVDAVPSDLYAAQFYGYAASRLDTLGEAIRIYERIDSLMPKETYMLLNLAEAYMRNRQQKEAVEALERYEKIEGRAQPVSLKKISYMLAGGDTVGAVKEGRNLIEMNPKDPSYRILMSNLYEVIGDNDSIFLYLKQAEELNPDNGAVKMSLANYYLNQGDSVAFDAKIYEALLSEDFQLEEKLAILGEYLQSLITDKGDTNRGDYLFNALMEQYPHEPQMLDLAARYNGAKGDYGKAAEEIRYAIDLDPTNVNYWGQLMQYRFADDKFEEMIQIYADAKEHIKVPLTMSLMYASAASQLQDYRLAESVYAELIHQFNENLPLTEPVTDTAYRKRLDYDGLMRISSLYNMLGDMYYAEKDFDKAFRAYDNSLFFYASNPLTLNNYAYFLTETGGDLEKAEKMSRRALDEDGNNPTYIDTYAWILFKKQDYKRALEMQEEAVKKAEENGEKVAEYYSHLGDIYFMNHNPQAALENWMKALELEPDNALLKKKVEHKTFFFE